MFKTSAFIALLLAPLALSAQSLTVSDYQNLTLTPAFDHSYSDVAKVDRMFNIVDRLFAEQIKLANQYADFDEAAMTAETVNKGAYNEMWDDANVNGVSAGQSSFATFADLSLDNKKMRNTVVELPDRSLRMADFIYEQKYWLNAINLMYGEPPFVVERASERVIQLFVKYERQMDALSKRLAKNSTKDTAGLMVFGKTIGTLGNMVGDDSLEKSMTSLKVLARLQAVLQAPVFVNRLAYEGKRAISSSRFSHASIMAKAEQNAEYRKLLNQVSNSPSNENSCSAVVAGI
jgi:hypothetical protein